MIRTSGWIFLMMAACLVLGSTSVWAGDSWQTWKEGQVTRGAWTDGQQVMVEVDGIPYAFMPQAKAYKISRRHTGGFSQEPIRTQSIFRTQDVNMLIQGFRIYQIKVTL